MKIYKIILLLACSAHTAFSQYMPEGFEDIKIGMSHEALMKVRPNLEPFSLGLDSGEIKNGSGMLLECFPSGTSIKNAEKFIIYGLKRNSLQTFNYTFKKDDVFSYLKKILKSEGHFNEIRPSTSKFDGLMVWEWENGELWLTGSLKSSKTNHYEFHYQVISQKILNEIKMHRKDKPIAYSNSFEDFKKRITAYAEGVLAEVEAQAEVTDVPLAVVAKAEGKSADQDGEYANTEYSEATVKKTVVLVLTAIALMLGFGLFYRLKR